jgi:uncharacterized membrane protein
MIAYLLAFLMGGDAGLRALMPLTAVSWAAQLGWLHVGQTWLAFLSYAWTPWIFTLLALVELVTDQLPTTPSRTIPIQLGARLVAGGFSGAAIALSGSSWIGGLVSGVIGAAIGTSIGAALRGGLARSFGSDRPAALIEDVIAIAGAVLIVRALH